MSLQEIGKDEKQGARYRSATFTFLDKKKKNKAKDVAHSLTERDKRGIQDDKGRRGLGGVRVCMCLGVVAGILAWGR